MARVLSLAALLLILGIVVAVILPGCCDHAYPPLQPGEDPFDQVTTVALGSSGAGAVATPLPSRSYKRCIRIPPTPIWTPIPPIAKVHPLLDSLLTSPGARRETLLVSFRDTLHVPRFPLVDYSLPLADSYNQSALRRIGSLIQVIQRSRAAQYHSDSLDLAQHFGARLIEKYWIAQAWLAEIPLAKVSTLRARPNILYIQPRRGGEHPPQCPTPEPSPCPPGAGVDNNTTNDVSDGRCQIGSDPYFNAGLGYGRIALLDNGVQSTHPAFQRTSPAVFGVLRDAVAVPLPSPSPSTTDCSSSSLADPFDHGTKSAAILTSGPVPTACFRGVTQALVDCYNVFDGNNSLVADAALRSIECAMAWGDPVIVAELQNEGPSYAAIGDMADNAFDSGRRVIAAVGNDPGSATGATPAGVPADARKAIGVGAVVVGGTTTIAGQRWAETDDHRFKPELQGPTNTETASSQSPSRYGYHTGTSGSTPYVAGAASLLANWLHNAGTNDPGATYAQLILAGTKTGPFAKSKVGAGPVQLPTSGTAAFGKVALDPCGCEVDVPILVESGVTEMDAALWWPERAQVSSNGMLVDTHNDVDAAILDPNGNAMGTPSDGAPGVFERTSYPPPGSVSGGILMTGTWKLKIRSKTLRDPPQKVYWAVALRH